jgi:hypothetical protein
MWRQPSTLFWFPPLWLACWAAGAAIAWASRAAQMSALSTPSICATKPWPTPKAGKSLLRLHVQTLRLRLRQDAPLVRRRYVMRRLMPVEG